MNDVPVWLANALMVAGILVAMVAVIGALAWVAVQLFPEASGAEEDNERQE